MHRALTRSRRERPRVDSAPWRRRGAATRGREKRREVTYETPIADRSDRVAGDRRPVPVEEPAPGSARLRTDRARLAFPADRLGADPADRSSHRPRIALFEFQ